MNMFNLVSKVKILFFYFALSFFMSCSTCYDYGCVEYEDKHVVDTLFVYDSVFVFDSVIRRDTLTKIDTVNFVDSLIVKDSVFFKDTLVKIDTIHYVDSLIIRDSVFFKDTLVKIDTLIIRDSIYFKDVIVVGQGGDYTTIMDAVNAAPNYSTLYILPGVYDEEVSLQNTGKFLRFIGFSKKLCVITHSNGDYNHATLEVAQGYFENLTFKSVGKALDEGASMFAYTAHIDYYDETNSSLQFVNCDFENEARECIGIGMRGNFALSFVGCTFHVKSQATQYPCPIFLAHEYNVDNVDNQRIEVVDCTFYDSSNRSSFGVKLSENPTLSNNNAYIKFQRNVFKADNGWIDGTPLHMTQRPSGTPIDGTGDKWNGSYIWNLDATSGMNSDSIFNN